MPKNFSVDDTLFRAQAKKLVKHLKIDETKFVRDQAGMLAQNFASITPPFVSYGKPKLNYGTKKDLMQGAKTTTKGFYQTIQMMTTDGQNWKSKSLRAAIQRGDMNYLEARLKHFKRSKKRNLKVRKYSDNLRNKKRNKQTGRPYKDVTPYVVLSRADADRGLARAVSHVGLAKAVFAKAAIRLGRKKPIKDIARHLNSVHASVFVTKNPSTAGFKISSHGLNQAEKRIKEVETFRLKGMVKRLKRLVEIDAQFAGFKVKKLTK
jgi:hypothetical protein